MRKKSNKTILSRIKRGKECCVWCGYIGFDFNIHGEYWYDTTCKRCGQILECQDYCRPINLFDECVRIGVRSRKEIVELSNRF